MAGEIGAQANNKCKNTKKRILDLKIPAFLRLFEKKKSAQRVEF